jgi:hypothetical protein
MSTHKQVEYERITLIFKSLKDLVLANSAPDRIGNSGFAEALLSQQARVASTTGDTLGRRVIARGGQGEVKAEIGCPGNDLSLGHP